VLVYSFEGNGFSGEFLNANGNVVSIELGSYEGTVVKTTEIPANFALNQNYPNPFNPATTISFNLPVASEYTLTVYNVTGQVVTQFAGEAEAGVVSLEWDASMNASGIYFYKLNAGDFSATKKMVLLK
jgi:flagellar hook assembly protein FlgD